MMTRLDDGQRAAFLAEHAGWAVDAEVITKTYTMADFNESMGFVTRVALLAEVADHHPDIDIRWNKVTIALSTHSEGALTSKDTALAEAIEAL
jgi:4a-hydroxytetrahydrobiopterin dehydratase